MEVADFLEAILMLQRQIISFSAYIEIGCVGISKHEESR
jgi:hypothetical protein